MSGFGQTENTNRGPDSVVDIYHNSLYILKEKVMALLGHYHETVLRKMDCDIGNLVSWDTSTYQSQLVDVFAQLNEIEVCLSELEAWAGLPPECFIAAASANLNCPPPNPDQVSNEAQTLVEAVQLLQTSLRQMITKRQPTNSVIGNSSSTDDNEYSSQVSVHHQNIMSKSLTRKELPTQQSMVLIEGGFNRLHDVPITFGNATYNSNDETCASNQLMVTPGHLNSPNLDRHHLSQAALTDIYRSPTSIAGAVGLNSTHQASVAPMTIYNQLDSTAQYTSNIPNNADLNSSQISPY